MMLTLLLGLMSATGQTGYYTMNINASDPTKTYYIRAFMIITNENGDIITLYSSMVTGSYNSLQ